MSGPDVALNHSGGRILVGDVRAMLRTLESESVSMCVTSPPYWSLRSYSTDPQVWGGDPDCVHAFDPEPTAEGYTGKRKWQHTGDIRRETEPENWSQVTRGDTCRHCGAWRGELGGEPTPDLYVEHIVEVFREVRRVLRRDGTAWVNLGDSYASQPAGNKVPSYGSIFDGRDMTGVTQSGWKDKIKGSGLKPKDLVGIPWRVAFALQADGWYLRQDIIWNKPAAMPESVRDRCTKSHEYVFLLSKSARYYFDSQAIAEPVVKGAAGSTFTNGKTGIHQLGRASALDRVEDGIRNKRSVWTINTEPTTIQHFATFPEKLVEPCILAGTSERGVCRDCGAPWRRVVEKGELVGRGTQPGQPAHLTPQGYLRDGKSRAGVNEYIETTGWQPTCKHNGDPIPATVLDIFLGSGTAARVAERLGRRWIGIELNENYAEIARRRTAQQSLLAWAGGAS